MFTISNLYLYICLYVIYCIAYPIPNISHEELEMILNSVKSLSPPLRNVLCVLYRCAPGLETEQAKKQSIKYTYLA